MPPKEDENSPPLLEQDSDTSEESDGNEAPRRSSRSRRPNAPVNLGDDGEVTQEKLLQGCTVNWTGHGTTDSQKDVKVEQMCTPSSCEDAITCDDRVEWKKALHKEHQNFFDNKVVEVVKRPRHANATKNLLLFRNKKKADGTLDKRKARLCARGDA